MAAQCIYKDKNGCRCVYWEGHQSDHSCGKISNMNIKYAAKLMEIYERIHRSLLANSDTTYDWPICIDPRKRQIEFSEYLNTLNQDDPWVSYYKEVGDLVWKLIMLQPPKDTTGVK